MRRGWVAWGVGLALVVSPITVNISTDSMTALAAKGGNGGGNGGGGGNAGAGGNGGGAAKGDAGAVGRSSAPGQTKQEGSSATGKGTLSAANGASHFGKLNGFMHASSTALANASVKSPLGAIAQTYAGALASYLSVDQTKATPEQIETAQEKLESAALILGGIANKPVSNDVVAAVNSRLGELAKQDKLPGSDAEISAALSSLSSDDPAQKFRNDTLAARIAQMAANSGATD
ncbi:MAG: hypothetical protein ABW003_02035 [Microvirga sp.]